MRIHHHHLDQGCSNSAHCGSHSRRLLRRGASSNLGACLQEAAKGQQEGISASEAHKRHKQREKQKSRCGAACFEHSAGAEGGGRFRQPVTLPCCFMHANMAGWSP